MRIAAVDRFTARGIPAESATRRSFISRLSVDDARDIGLKRRGRVCQFLEYNTTSENDANRARTDGLPVHRAAVVFGA